MTLALRIYCLLAAASSPIEPPITLQMVDLYSASNNHHHERSSLFILSLTAPPLPSSRVEMCKTFEPLRIHSILHPATHQCTLLVNFLTSRSTVMAPMASSRLQKPINGIRRLHSFRLAQRVLELGPSVPSSPRVHPSPCPPWSWSPGEHEPTTIESLLLGPPSGSPSALEHFLPPTILQSQCGSAAAPQAPPPTPPPDCHSKHMLLQTYRTLALRYLTPSRHTRPPTARWLLLATVETGR